MRGFAIRFRWLDSRTRKSKMLSAAPGALGHRQLRSETLTGTLSRTATTFRERIPKRVG